MSKKSLLALMAAVMSPSFSVDLGIRSAIPSQGCRTMPHRPSGVRAYQEGGIGALEHPQSKTMTEHRKNPFIADKPDQEKTQAELIEELCYMRAEVAYLKELKALSQKQTEKDKAKPSKH